MSHLKPIKDPVAIAEITELLDEHNLETVQSNKIPERRNLDFSQTLPLIKKTAERSTGTDFFRMENEKKPFNPKLYN